MWCAFLSHRVLCSYAISSPPSVFLPLQCSILSTLCHTFIYAQCARTCSFDGFVFDRSDYQTPKIPAQIEYFHFVWGFRSEHLCACVISMYIYCGKWPHAMAMLRVDIYQTIILIEHKDKQILRLLFMWLPNRHHFGKWGRKTEQKHKEQETFFKSYRHNQMKRTPAIAIIIQTYPANLLLCCFHLLI